jgi:TRAP-type C4-dicarboxylate transport system permease small subunit
MSGDDLGTGKNILKSKTFWANLLSAIVFGYSIFFGKVVDPILLAQFMVFYFFFLNTILRFVTNEPIVWS